MTDTRPTTASTAPAPTAGLWNRRWDGTPGRLEVWYATVTDRATGTGLWVHGEVVAPADGGEPHQLGWAALFPPDAAPVWRRTPTSPGAPTGDPASFDSDGLHIGPSGTSGVAGALSWDLRWDSTDQQGIATLGRAAWDRELLPGAQVLPAPDLAVTGWVDAGDGPRAIDDAHGAVARIYGHGNAKRWAWLHAELGHGDLVEIVTAVSMRPGLDRLPPVAFVRFRLDGELWPSSPLPALRMRTELDLPTWTVTGRIGRSRVRIRVHQPQERNVVIGYQDPDGRTATCTNSERADLDVEILDGPGGGTRRWSLEGTAHAEVGTRP